MSTAKSARALKDSGWEIVIASAGCDWYIRYLLNKVGVSVVLHALSERGERFHRFERWSQIADQLQDVEC
jgi:phosphoserine phosphatase